MNSIVCFLDEHDDDKSMLVGGFYIPRSNLKDLDSLVFNIKEEFGLEHQHTVKWNLRDHACAEARKIIGDKNDRFRKALFQKLSELEVGLIVSQVWKGDPSNTSESWKWAFENVLQRLCIEINSSPSDEPNEYPMLDVVFDWLPSQRTRIDEYFGVYDSAYYNGYHFAENELPSLESSGACPCLLITSCRFSPALQVADMIVGATGEFFKFVYEIEREQNVKNYFSLLYPLFRRDNSGEVLGRGLITKRTSRDKIKNSLKELGLET